MATAPLTNLAVAVQLDPYISEKVKALYLMGGNTECRLQVDFQSVLSLFSFDFHVSACILLYDKCPCCLGSQGQHHSVWRV